MEKIKKFKNDAGKEVRIKCVKSEKYRYVYFISGYKGFSKPWMACKEQNKITWQQACNTELEAAKAVDLFLIKKGKKPLNNTIKKHD